jgi:hypothetical protein
VTRRPPRRKLMIMDACVLIDFIKAERAVLELVVKHVGPLHVTSPVIDEVNEIDRESEGPEMLWIPAGWRFETSRSLFLLRFPIFIAGPPHVGPHVYRNLHPKALSSQTQPLPLVEPRGK